MEMSPVIAVHLTAALLAVAIGPVALWARRGLLPRPRLHRAFGYAWVTLMLVTAFSAMFIRDDRLPNIAGYTPIHLVVPVTLVSLVGAFWRLARGDVRGHAFIMRQLYFWACVFTGVLTLLPQRYLGRLVWGEAALLLPILRHTPSWVWALLTTLVVLGLVQARERQASLLRVSVLPLGMTAFSLSATVSSFSGSPVLPEALWLWAMAAAAMTALLAPGQSAARYDAATRSFRLPGSWLPLALMLAIFLVRYVVAVRLAMQPWLVMDSGFALPLATLFGVFSGVFLGRAAQLWRLALPAHRVLAA